MNNQCSQQSPTPNLGERTKKIHRHHEPLFCGSRPNTVAVKRFSAALERHDWNRNPLIYALRCQSDQRISVRSERRETYNALALAVIANCDYSPDSEYIFEVMCSVKDLAKQTGQLHRDPISGRQTYDPVLEALKDWKEAGLIVVLKGKDPDTRQQKAMRIWLRPEFFSGLGFSVAELRDIAVKFRMWMERNGLRENFKKRYAEHVLRIARSNVAEIKDKHSLKNMLKKIKRTVIGADDDDQQKKKAKLVSELEQKLLSTEQALKDAPATPSKQYWALYSRWTAQQPMAVSMKLENAAKNEQPDLKGEAFYQFLLERIRQSGL